MMGDQCFCLRWNNYQSSVVGDLRSLLEQEEFVDVTLACEGRRLKAHRLMLSACSNYFKNLLKENPSEHPIIFLRDVHFWELESIMDFIYNGQVNVMQDKLPGFIRTAEALQIKGLAAVNNNNVINNNTISPPKMYDLKNIQEMLLRSPEHLKASLSPKIRSPNHPAITNTLLSPDMMNPAKILPPLIQPNKKFRSEGPNSYLGGNHPMPYKDILSPRHSPNNVNCTRFSPFPKDLSTTNGDASLGCQDLSKKENSPVNADGALDLKSPRKLSPHSHNGSNGDSTTDNGNGVKEERLTPPEFEDTKGHPDSRSGSPGDERIEIDDDRFSHDGNPPISDGMREEWNMDQSNSLSFGVNEAGMPICKVCGKVFKHQGSLVAHYQVHQQRTKCPVCKKVLSRHYHMKVHLLTVHKVPDSEIEGLLRSQNIA